MNSNFCEPMSSECIQHPPFWYMVQPVCQFCKMREKMFRKTRFAIRSQPNTDGVGCTCRSPNMFLFSRGKCLQGMRIRGGVGEVYREREMETGCCRAASFAAASALALPQATGSLEVVWATHLQTEIAVGKMIASRRSETWEEFRIGLLSDLRKCLCFYSTPKSWTTPKALMESV